MKQFCSKYKRAILGFTFFIAIGLVIGIIIGINNPEASYKTSVLFVAINGESIFGKYFAVIGIFTLGALLSLTVALGKLFCFSPIFVLFYSGFKLGKTIICLAVTEKVLGIFTLLLFELWLYFFAVITYMIIVVVIKENMTYLKLIGFEWCNKKAFFEVLKKTLRYALCFYLLCFIQVIVFGGIIQLFAVRI